MVTRLNGVNSLAVVDENYLNPTTKSKAEFKNKLGSLILELLENNCQVMVKYEDVGVYVVEFCQNYDKDLGYPELEWLDPEDVYTLREYGEIYKRDAKLTEDEDL